MNEGISSINEENSLNTRLVNRKKIQLDRVKVFETLKVESER